MNLSLIQKIRSNIFNILGKFEQNIKIEKIIIETLRIYTENLKMKRIDEIYSLQMESLLYYHFYFMTKKKQGALIWFLKFETRS
jgi:hypothetical protein